MKIGLIDVDGHRFSIKKIGAMPFAQPLIRFDTKNCIPHRQLDPARYANRLAIPERIDFKDYRPRRGFTCAGYFKTGKEDKISGARLSV